MDRPTEASIRADPLGETPWHPVKYHHQHHHPLTNHLSNLNLNSNYNLPLDHDLYLLLTDKPFLFSYYNHSSYNFYSCPPPPPLAGLWGV